MTKNKTYEKKTIIHERLHQKLKNEQHKSTPTRNPDWTQELRKGRQFLFLLITAVLLLNDMNIVWHGHRVDIRMRK